MRNTLAVVALALAGSLAAAPAAHAQSANRYLNAAMKLYADLEYESALENLKKARDKGGLTDEEDIQSSLYMGLIQFELGNVADAESAFKAALALKCELTLPKAVSPKAVVLFQKSRKDIWKGTTCPVAKVEPKPATDVPKEQLVVAVKPQPEPVVPVPRTEVKAPAATSTRTVGLAVGVPLIAIGAGLLGGGGYFGIQSGNYVDKMQDPSTWQNDPVNHEDVPTYKDKADSAALKANILLGVGAAVVVAGAVTLIATLASSSGEAPTTVDAEMPGR